MAGGTSWPLPLMPRPPSDRPGRVAPPRTRNFPHNKGNKVGTPPLLGEGC